MKQSLAENRGIAWPWMWYKAFHGQTVDELESAFREAVDDDLATCNKLGAKPGKPYSGKLTLRIPPTVHATIATAAETSGKSIYKWVADVLDRAAQNS